MILARPKSRDYKNIARPKGRDYGMKKINYIFYVLLFLLVLPDLKVGTTRILPDLKVGTTTAFAYPTSVKKTLSLGLSQATGGMSITDDDRYLFVAHTDSLKMIDLGKFALASSQPATLSEDEGTDGNIGGIAFSPMNDYIYAAQDDGDLLRFNLNAITDDPVSSIIAADKTLVLMAIDQTAASPVLYIGNNTDSLLYISSPASGSSPTIINLKDTIQDANFTMNDILFAPDTDEVYIATSIGIVIYMAGSGSSAAAIELDSERKANIKALAATPDGTKVYAADSTNNQIEIISTSTHTAGTPIAIDTDDNSGLADIVVANVATPAGDIYGFVSGEQGITLFDTYDDTLFDLDTTNDANTYDPISTSYYGYLAASDDYYIYLSSGGGEISVITDKPYITSSSVSYADSAAATATALKSGGTTTITFQSDEAGTYAIRSGGSIDQSGTLLTDTSSATSGSVSAATDVSASFAYDTISSSLSEGSNTFFIFVTDSDNLVGRVGVTVTVDNPPLAVTIQSTGFGSGRAYVNFSRLTASDISYYNIYADTDAATVQTKTGVSATVTQPASGDTVEGSVSGLANGTTYYLAVEGVDSASTVGPRAYLLSNGSAASAVPQETVGPSGLSGETGGCSLVR